jgi:small GTP-binding protein
MRRVRAVFCGEALVGKSSIIHRFATKTFSEMTSTVAGSFRSPLVQYGDEVVQLELWDTAGSERYHSVIPSFFKTASAVVVVYDITSRESFTRLPYWIEFTRSHSPEDCQVLLVGNKTDLSRKRAVTFEEGHTILESHHLAVFTETSAKSGESIDTLFWHLAGLPGSGTVERPEEAPVIQLREPGCC